MIKFNILEKYNSILIHGFSEKSDGDFRLWDTFLKSACRLGIDFNSLVRYSQLHGDEILDADEKNTLKSVNESVIVQGYDAFVTGKKNVCLTGVFADCVPVLLFDPVKMVVSIVHSGWKGTALAIIAKTIKHMKNIYGCSVNDLIGVIGPCICGNCYEISDETAQRLIKSVNSLPEGIIIEKDIMNKKYSADIGAIVNIQMLLTGMRSENIEKSDMCTCCSSAGDFYSYRRDGITGRMAAFLMLVSSKKGG